MDHRKLILLICIQIFVLIVGVSADSPSFKVDYDNDQFLLDGKPFRYISGSIHYFRIHPDLWLDRLMRVRALGFNAIQYYIPWNYHQPEENEFLFSGDRNFSRFSEIASSLGMYTLLRIGPYICSEWENGGLPWWLLKRNDITLRTADPQYLAPVAKWYNKLLPLVRPMMRHNGGPVLMVQIENEYGSYLACDNLYMSWLRDISWQYLGNQTQLYTTDPPQNLNCGSVDGVYATVDFGPRKDADIDSAFKAQREYTHGKGPLVNSEFYPGWYVTWGQQLRSNIATIQELLDSVGYMYSKGASFNVYMVHGGTNFGFWNGREYYGSLITSYDYFAPISEAGDVTQQYLALRLWIRTLKGWDTPPQDLPKDNKKLSYGSISMQHVSQLPAVPSKCVQSTNPLTFEQLGQGYGFVTYTTNLTTAGHLLKVVELNGRGYLFLNGIFVNVFNGATILPTTTSAGDEVTILVENEGRLTWETINDYKGILSDVTLDGKKLTNWKTCAVDMQEQFHEFVKSKAAEGPVPGNKYLQGVYTGSFQAAEVADTFFSFSSWGKGVLFVNGHNMGRYWSQGPQMTLYVPAPYIQMGNNTITVVELEFAGCTSSCSLQSKNNHVWRWRN